jgi:hypothetical protein
MKPLDHDEAIEKLRVTRHRLESALSRFYEHDLSGDTVALGAAVLDISTPIRVMVHHARPTSVSLLYQIDPDYWDKLIHFRPLITPPPRTLPSGERTMSVSIPINMTLSAHKTSFTRYKPGGDSEARVPLKKWWFEPCWDSGTNKISNRDMVLSMTNKEGGAHVDGDVSAKYKSAKDQGRITIGQTPVKDIVRLGSLVAMSGDELMEYLHENFQM